MLPRRHPALHAFSLGVVVLLHIGIAYLLLTGPGRKVARALLPPIETFIVAETKPPPAEPGRAAPPPRQTRPLQVPPVARPAAPPTSQAISAAPTPSPVEAAAPQPGPAEAPPAPVVEPASAPRAAASSAPVSIGTACPNSQSVRQQIGYPRAALRAGLTGEVLVEFTVTASGAISNPIILESSNVAFNRVSLDAVRQFECRGQGRDVRVQVPFVFKLE